jgi:hypothetical protein
MQLTSKVPTYLLFLFVCYNNGGNMNTWTENFYHDEKGKILGSVMEYGGQHKALIDKMFLGWFISERYAKKAVEEAFEDSIKEPTKKMPDYGPEML